MLRRARIVAILLAFIPLPAAFAQNTVDLETYREAGAKFVSLVADAEQKKEQNRLRTAEADRLVAVLSDEQHLLKTGQYNANELGELLDLCGVSNRAVMSLALFSLKDQIDPQANPQVIARQVASFTRKNLQSFARHLRYLQPFWIRCAAKQMQPMTEFVGSLPSAQFTQVRREGLQQTQMGITQLFSSVIQNMGDDGIDETYRRALAQALAETAPELVSILPVSTRLQLRSIALSVRESSPPGFRPYLNKIGKALDDKTCNGLCSI